MYIYIYIYIYIYKYKFQHDELLVSRDQLSAAEQQHLRLELGLLGFGAAGLPVWGLGA